MFWDHFFLFLESLDPWHRTESTPTYQPKSPEGLGTPNMDILMAKAEEPTPLVNPPEGVMDRIHFVINNVTTSNLSSKVSVVCLESCVPFIFVCLTVVVCVCVYTGCTSIQGQLLLAQHCTGLVVDFTTTAVCGIL